MDNIKKITSFTTTGCVSSTGIYLSKQLLLLGDIDTDTSIIGVVPYYTMHFDGVKSHLLCCNFAFVGISARPTIYFAIIFFIISIDIH